MKRWIVAVVVSIMAAAALVTYTNERKNERKRLEKQVIITYDGNEMKMSPQRREHMRNMAPLEETQQDRNRRLNSPFEAATGTLDVKDFKITKVVTMCSDGERPRPRYVIVVTQDARGGRKYECLLDVEARYQWHLANAGLVAVRVSTDTEIVITHHAK